jgi:hypothetical protein
VVTLTVTVAAPAILTDLVDVGIYSGENLSFTLVASGIPTPVYRWYYNETNLLSGESGTSLLLTNVQAGQAGSYHAVASNYLGSVTSRVATLTVSNVAPTFVVLPPATTNVAVGATAVVTTQVVGSQPMTFQWYFTPDGELGATPLDGQTNAVLTIPSFQLANVGLYTLIAENSFGTPDVQVRIETP